MRMQLHIVISLLFTASMLTGQTEIRWENHAIQLQQCQLLKEPVKYDQPVQNEDAEYVKLFKQYFNPGSLTAFREYYLPVDWIGSTQKEYDEWQSYLKANPIYLESVIRVLKDQDQFLILQYTVQNEYYTIYQSSEFKRIGPYWKHTHMDNDELAPLLSRIGSLSPQYVLEQISNRKSDSDLDLMVMQHARTHVEKFDREEIFEAMLPVFKNKSMSEADIKAVRQYFIEHRDNDMITYISNRYRWPETELADMMNTVCGFELFNYASAARNEN